MSVRNDTWSYLRTHTQIYIYLILCTFSRSNEPNNELYELVETASHYPTGAAVLKKWHNMEVNKKTFVYF
jgi:hypothetical protein